MPTSLPESASRRVKVSVPVLTATLLILLMQPVHAQSPPPSGLQRLVNDTALQFRLAYRHNATEHHRRHGQLVEVVAAWRGAPRSDANNRLLADWLRGAIRTSMPGSREPLPPAPKFQSATAVVKSAAEPTRAAVHANAPRENIRRPDQVPAPATDKKEKSTGDPFGDDPL